MVLVRSGKQIGNETFYPKNAKNESSESVLTAFLPLYYLGKNTPKEIVISHKLKDKSLLEEGLITKLIHLPRIDKKHFLELATLNAKENLKQRLLSKYTKKKQLEAIQKILALKKLPEVMECFDISHMMGEATTASCVVFEKGSPKTSEYRQFNIKDITPGDDYAAINQAVFRRYSRLQDTNKEMPDIVFIDGGLVKLNQAIMIMN